MDPRAQQVLFQQRQLNRQAEANVWGDGDEYVDEMDMLQSQAIRDTVTDLDDATISGTVMELYRDMEFLDLLDFVKGLFRGSTKGELGSRPRKFEVRRRTLFLELLELLMQSHLAQTKKHLVFCTQLVDLLQREIDTLDMTSVPSLIEHVLLGIEKAYRDQEESASVIPMPLPSADLLPHLYGRMLCFSHVALPSHAPSIWDFSDEAEWTGAVYVEKSLDRLLQARWPLRLLAQMVNVLREVAWSADQHAAICTKFLAQLSIEMTPIEDGMQPDYALLPGLYYHLLLFVRDHPRNLKAMVLQSLVAHLDQLSIDATKPKHHRAPTAGHVVFGPRELRAFQATILYQLEKLLAQDTMLGAVLLEMLMPYRLTQSWTSTHFALLLLLRSHNKFTATIDKNCLEYFHTLATTSSDGVTLLLDVLEAFERGQMEVLLSSAVALGFSLFESKDQKVLDVGVQVILYTFRHHECVRASVLEAIVHWCLSTTSMTSLPPKLPHIKLLGALLQHCVMDLDAAFLDRVRDLLEYLPGFSLEVARSVLRTLPPLLKHKVHLRNALVLTLRKAMFRREESSRAIAIHGFCTILDCVLSLSGSAGGKPKYLTQMVLAHNASSSRPLSSQSLTQRAFVSQSQSILDMDAMEFDAGHLPSVFRQFAGMFRRAMACQKSVRATLYRELKTLVKLSPDLASSVEDLVWPTLSALIETNAALTPALQLKPDEATPLLLDLVLTCSPEKVHSVLERLLHMELQDYELDASPMDPSVRVTAAGKATIDRASDLLKLCDVVLNYVWGKDDGMRSSRLRPDQLEHTLKLVQLRESVQEIVVWRKKERGPKAKADKDDNAIKAKTKTVQPSATGSTASPVMTPHCLVHPRNLLMALQSIFGHGDVTHHYNVQQCVLQYSHDLLLEWSLLSSRSWLEVKPLLIFRMSVRTQKDFLAQLARLLWSAADGGLSATGKQSLAAMAYETLVVLLSIAPDLAESTLGTVEHIQKKIFALLRQSHEAEADLVLQLLITHWYPRLPTRLNAWKWMEAICIGQALTSLPLVTRLFTTLLLEPSYRVRISTAMLAYLEGGDAAGNDDEDDDRVTYACLNAKTIVLVAGVFLDAFDKSCGATEHTLKTVKAMSEVQLDAVLDQLTELSRVIAPLITVSFPHGPTTLRLFRMLLRLFKLHALAIQAKIKSKVSQVSPPLKTFLDATSRELAPLVLNFVACHHEENKRKAVANPKKKMPAQEAKLIPDVIYQVEQYDVGIIKLSKRCKTTNFKRWCIRRQARDFRFNQDKVQVIIGANDNDEADADDDEDEDGGVAAPPEESEDEQAPDEDEEDDDCPATARHDQEDDDDDDDDDAQLQSRHIKRRRLMRD
ncbi:hypothetical protein SPRG_08268 [Saprolegnia parasitica CBS 223.65]|uniref:FANCI solenoid 4 domain-containing protein n=1 Tax=Saprolegnia parasitica (strain CBS 223.65) TaxID=695850 RepID=A0A067CB99_SAPPC|nr:hypothetical protein SPRG_08268 [Saprolegnia parasitica CBS 223.65]KDO26465.1 hypothetical protein SPRG_08268 [Saprolegnia parasitica CBS 223.65]|eukprot:XP_012202900.1 hypothetical protein SPRG_08268 [Saprolegnia parasitica CBS 223.65]